MSTVYRDGVKHVGYEIVQAGDLRGGDDIVLSRREDDGTLERILVHIEDDVEYEATSTTDAVIFTISAGDATAQKRFDVDMRMWRIVPEMFAKYVTTVSNYTYERPAALDEEEI